MADLDIQYLRFDKKEVGKTFSSSKILYTWEFVLNKKSHKIQFYDSRLSYKKKLTLDGSVLFYEKDDSELFKYKFSLAGAKFELFSDFDDNYDIKVNGIKFKQLMSDERNGKLEKRREKRIAEENEQKKIDEYNKRAMEYNGSNYYEGMEYKILEKEREIERQKEREKERQHERELEEEDEDDDDFFNDNEINQIKNNLQHSMNKGGNNNDNFFNNSNNNNNQDPFFNNQGNFGNNSNNNMNNNITDFFDFGNNNKNNNQMNDVFDFTKSQNFNNQYRNNNNNGYINNNYNNQNNINN